MSFAPPGVAAPELWAKLLAFDLDGGAQLSFSKRLARDNGWSVAFAQRVVLEYKKFVFLAATCGHPLQWKAHELPIYPVPVRAGFAALLASEGDRGQLEIVRIYKPSPELRKAGTLVFEIDEVPMEPQLRAGMLVAGTTVPL
jgi:hypothetical protein